MSAALPRSWRDHLKVHPAADLLPRLDDASLAELAKDIADNGLRVPLGFWQDEGNVEWLIDGRSRMDAMAGLPDSQHHIDEALQKAIRYDANVDPWQLAISLNIERRHLGITEKREVALLLLKRDATQSDRAIARTVGIDHKTASVVRGEAEARGEIPHVPTRIDRKGRSQPAKKATPLASSVGKSASRDQAVVNISALLSRDSVQGIEDIVRMLRDEKGRIESITPENRKALAVKLLTALGVDLQTMCNDAARFEATP